MTPQELEKYRLKLIRDASSMQVKPERVPHVSFFVTWKILDSQYKLSEAMNDYSIMEKVVRQHQEKYGFDAIFEYGGRNAIRIPAALGGTSYIVNDEAGTVSYLDKALAEREELDELIADHRNLLNAIERCDLAAFEPLVERHLYGGIRRLGSKLTGEYADYFEPEPEK